MKAPIHQSVPEIIQGDITQQDTEAIGNAANSRLAGGGGVDGAIHRAGGPEIMAELKAKYPQGCPTGSAVNIEFLLSHFPPSARVPMGIL